MPNEWQGLGWLVLVPAELAIPVWAERPAVTSWHPRHIAERYGLFTLIVLGESVLAATVAIQSAVDAGAGADVILIAAGGLLTVFSMWWLYFSKPVERIVEHARDQFGNANRFSFLWGYGHYVVFAAAAAVGAGIAVAVDQATDHTELSDARAGLTVAVPVALYILGVWLLHARRLTPPGPVRSSFPAVAGLVVVASALPRPVLAIGLILSAVRCRARGCRAPSRPSSRPKEQHMPINVAIGLGVLAVAIVAFWGWIALVRRRGNKAQELGRAGPTTMELGPEPPAVVNLLVHELDVTGDALAATLLDLAARDHVEIIQVSPEHHLVKPTRRSQPLRSFEEQVLSTVERAAAAAPDGVVTVDALSQRAGSRLGHDVGAVRAGGGARRQGNRAGRRAEGNRDDHAAHGPRRAHVGRTAHHAAAAVDLGPVRVLRHDPRRHHLRGLESNAAPDARWPRDGRALAGCARASSTSTAPSRTAGRRGGHVGPLPRLRGCVRPVRRGGARHRPGAADHRLGRGHAQRRPLPAGRDAIAP